MRCSCSSESDRVLVRQFSTRENLVSIFRQGGANISCMCNMDTKTSQGGDFLSSQPGVVQDARHPALLLPSAISISSPAPVCTTALADRFIKVLFTTLTLGNKLTAEIITRFKTRMTDPDWKVLRETGCLGTSETLRI